MKLNKMIIVLIVSFLIIIGLVFGMSYAWYTYSNAETKIEGTTIKEKPTIKFSQTEYINDVTIMPILDEDRYQYATFNSFTVEFNETLKNYEVGIEINLENIEIDNELISDLYKYELVQDNNIIKSGNFTEVVNNKINLLPMESVNLNELPQQYNYKLYIWLSDDGSNQNNLMNKKFSGKIVLNNAIKTKGR